MERLQRQVGHESLIAVAANWNKCKWAEGFFGHWSADDDEAPRPEPALRTIPKLGRPHSRRHVVVPQSQEPILQRTGQPGDDRVASPFFLDKLDDFVIEEGSVGTNSHRAARLRQLPKGPLESHASPMGQRADGRSVSHRYLAPFGSLRSRPRSAHKKLCWPGAFPFMTLQRPKHQAQISGSAAHPPVECTYHAE